MAIRIGHGYRMPLVGLEDLQRIMIRYRDAVQREASKQYLSLFMKLAVRIMDETLVDPDIADGRYSEYGGIWENSAYRLAFRKIRHEQQEIERSNRRNPKYDFSCTLDFLPAQEHLYFFLHTEKECFRELILEIEGVEHYPFWTSDDSYPSGVTAEEWERRGEEWKAAMGSSWLPKKAGLFRFDCQVELPPAEAERLVEWQPDFDRRVNKLAHDITVTRKTKQLVESDPLISVDERGFVGANPAIHHAVDAFDWVDTEEGQESFRCVRDEVAIRLEPFRIVKAEHLEMPLRSVAAIKGAVR